MLHDIHFPNPRTPDEEWIPEVAKQGWIALSHNKHIQRTKNQIDLVMHHGLALFFLIGKNHDEVTKNVVQTAPRIVRFRQKYEPPFVAKVHRPPAKFVVGTRPGDVEMSLTLEEWQDFHRRLHGD